MSDTSVVGWDSESKNIVKCVATYLRHIRLSSAIF